MYPVSRLHSKLQKIIAATETSQSSLKPVSRATFNLPFRYRSFVKQVKEALHVWYPTIRPFCKDVV